VSTARKRQSCHKLEIGNWNIASHTRKELELVEKKLYAHGRRKFFSRGGHLGIFPKFFQGGPKVVKFVFPTEN